MINPIKHLLSHANLSPNKPAIVSTKLSISFKECLEKVQHLALKFRRLGIKPGQIVVVIFEDRTLEWLVTLALIHEATVTVSHGYYKLPEELNADLILCDREFDKSLFKTKYQVLDQTWFVADENIKDITPQDYPSENSLLRITLSSGSTGEPKCIALTVKVCEKRAFIILNHTEICFDKTIILFKINAAFHTVYAIFLLNGKTYYDFDYKEQILELIKIAKADSLFGSPAQLIGLIDYIKEKNINITNLKEVTYAGSKISLVLLNEIKSHLCKKVVNMYGTQELWTVSCNLIQQHHANLDIIGLPLSDTQVQIVDEQETILTNEQEGLIRIKTPGMVEDYYNNKNATKIFFKDGWFYSGDTGYLTKQGEIVLTGRNDERINLNGVKVNPSKIDRIIESYPDVKEAACFPLTKSDGRIILGAVFVSEQKKFDLKKLVDYLLIQSEQYPVPEIFIQDNKIPRNYNYKIARHELSKKYSVSENNELLSQ